MIDLVRTQSPAALAAQIPGRFGLRAPLDLFDLTEDEHRRWAEAFHGGWCEADSRLLAMPFSAVAADISSAYPLVAHHLGWWAVMRAAELVRRDVTDELRQLCAKTAQDPAVALHPGVWRRFGLTLVEVAPKGERFPVAVDDPHRPDGRLEVASVTAEDRTMWFSWPDVVLAAVLSGRAPRIVGAIKYKPVGHQRMFRRLPVLPGLMLDSDEDPAVGLVRRRRSEKDRYRRAIERGDNAVALAHCRTAALLRVVANALVSGNPSRVDGEWRYDRKSRKWAVHDKRPGPWCFFPIASSVTAGARLLLALAKRMAADRGSAIVYWDTDGALIPATAEGGPLQLSDGSTIRALSYSKVDEIFATFEPLSPEPGWPVWKLQRDKRGEPLQAIIYGPKRHVEFVVHEDATVELIEATEARLGGTYADPPALRGRVAPVDGYRLWSMASVCREVEHSLNRAENPDALRPLADWDAPGDPSAPAPGCFMVKTPRAAAALPFEARPGTRYLQLERVSPGAPLVALDPGGDLSGWRELAWFDKETGKPVRPATDHAGLDEVLVVTLDEKAVNWSRPPRTKPLTEVVVTPHNVKTVGRTSGVIDAEADGEPGNLHDYRPVYQDADHLAMIHAHARQVGPTAFARLTGLPLRVAKRVALGQRISSRNVAKALATLEHVDTQPATCALPGCDRPARRRWCSASHRAMGSDLARGLVGSGRQGPTSPRSIPGLEGGLSVDPDVSDHPDQTKTSRQTKTKTTSTTPLPSFGETWCEPCDVTFLGHIPKRCPHCGGPIARGLR